MSIRNYLILTFTIATASSCNKSDNTPEPQPYALSYGTSVLYIKSQEYYASPTQSSPGTYSAFPNDGIDLNPTTGAIRVKGDDNNIYTGLKYRITHTAPNGDTSSTIVMISGITFFDKFYILSQGDSIAPPIYNGSAANILPLAGSSFDNTNLANASGCAVKTTNGQINLAQTLRNGFFGADPQNDAKGVIKIDYKLNDASENAQNKIDVKLYYYKTMADVAPDLLQTLNDRQSQGVFLGMNSSLQPGFISTARTGGVTAIAKPRPPCIILIASQ